MARRASMKDIAEMAGVSKTTVSLALRNDPQISKQQKQKIQQIAKKLGYARNPKIGELMAQMRSEKSNNPHGILAIINCNQNADAFHDHPTIPNYVEGCKRRAAMLGFATDSFWLYEANMTPQRWITILKSRGISGIILVGMMRQNKIPDFFKTVVAEFPTTVTGVRTRKPALSFSCADHHMLTLQAFEKAIELGYKRPGIVIEQSINELVAERFTAAFYAGQSKHLEPKDRVKAFTDFETSKIDLRQFKQWLDEEKPDVILTLYSNVKKWLGEFDYEVPQNMGLIQLEWRKQHPDWAGMHQHNDICGEAAVEMAINMIYNGESGFPVFPRATLIGSTWMDGKTIRKQ